MAGVLDTAAAATIISFPSSPSQLSLVSTSTTTTTSTQQPPAVASRLGGNRPPNYPHPNLQTQNQILNAGPSLQRMAKVYATTAEAIANFKPTPREVISGIAPHVFDERKRRRSQRRSHAHGGPKPYWYGHGGQKKSSPLRGATVISWDEHSIYLGACFHRYVTLFSVQKLWIPRADLVLLLLRRTT